ncbi:TIR domain-containing protein [Actinoplanes awajinensis]|uniref:TIR domain-containing protein n=1 Tax=Actinoplanes awajinensis TaxID=135946 RepID=UPI000A057873|nr:TIR domain-containing protein [Actinoplanes awajinensis]
MPYRNKTYVAFASEDLHYYRLMTAWRDNEHIKFDLLDAHSINTALDTSQPDTIRRRLRERLANTKQAVVLISDTTKPKAARSNSFLYYEIEVIARLNLPVVFVNLNGSRRVQSAKIPTTLVSQYSASVSFQPKIVQYALDEHVEDFYANLAARVPKTGAFYYEATIYEKLGL